MSQISDILQTIDGATKQFASTLDKSQARLLAEALDLAKTLDIKNGKIAPSIENLKRISSIKAKLNKAVVNSDYLKSVKDLVGNFDTIQAAQNAYFYPMAAKFTAAKKQALIKEISIDNTISQLTETGLAANVTDEIRNKLLKSVTSGAQYNDLVAEMTQYLTDTEESPGALSKYAQTYVNTSLNQFAGNNNKLMTEDLGMEWFRYVGSNKETSREFCIHLEAKDYVHVSEIPGILRGVIDGHKCKIYPATGLPYGMIDGTTPDNFMTNRGGWNCGHQLIPVMEASVPASTKAKITQSATEYTKQLAKELADKKAAEAPKRAEYENMKAKLDQYTGKTKSAKPKAPKPAANKSYTNAKMPADAELSAMFFGERLKVKEAYSTKLIKDYMANRGNPAVKNQTLTKAEYEALRNDGDLGGEINYTPTAKDGPRIDAYAAKHGITPEEKVLIYSYTDMLYGSLNNQSRNGYTGANTLINDRIASAMEKLPPFTGTATRFIDVGDNVAAAEMLQQFKSLGPGKAVTFDQLLSTSKNSAPGNFDGRVVLKIKSKTGRDIDQLSAHGGENEILFKADAKFKFISGKVEDYEGYGSEYTVIKLEEI